MPWHTISAHAASEFTVILVIGYFAVNILAGFSTVAFLAAVSHFLCLSNIIQ